jgi:hypothetical protein
MESVQPQFFQFRVGLNFRGNANPIQKYSLVMGLYYRAGSKTHFLSENSSSTTGLEIDWGADPILGISMEQGHISCLRLADNAVYY